MRLKFSSGLVSAALVALVAGCGGQVAAENVNEGGTGGAPACGSCTGGASGTGGTGTGGTPQAQCDLGLITAGALPRQGQRNVDSVAIAASSKSYTIAYVEEDPTDSTRRNTALVSLTDSGQLGGVVRDDLPGCVGPPVSRGSAVTFDTSGSAGLAAFAVSNCGGSGAGAMFFHLTANAGPASPKLAVSNEFTTLSLGPHSLAPADTDQYAFAYVPQLATSPGGSSAQLATLTGDAFNASVVLLFGGKAVDAVAVATSSGVRAVLGHLASGMEVLQTGAPDVDAGAGNEHQLGIEPWGAMTTIGSRVAVLLPTATGLEYRLFESNQQVHQGGLQGSTSAMADVAARGDRLIVVGAHDRSLDFYRIDNAATNPTGIQVGEFANGLGTMPIPPIKSLAIAAARSTVAVVMTGNGTRGHWALFSCKN